MPPPAKGSAALQAAGGEAIAVDWSGNAGSSHALVAARAAGGRLLEVVTGLGREEMVEWVIARDVAPLVVGLDFCFSLPRWFLANNGLSHVSSLWRLVAEEGESWLSECAPPFWGRPGKRRPASEAAQLRRTEAEVAPVAGVRPKSPFQIGGAGSVGTGSVRGMPFLLRLAEAGFHIWPFSPAGGRTVVEIWPRALTGPVVKRDPAARAERMRELCGPLDDTLVEKALATEDGFDAAASALVMSRHLPGLARLPSARDEVALLEGEIWLPPADGGAASASRPRTRAGAALSRSAPLAPTRRQEERGRAGRRRRPPRRRRAPA